MVSLEATKNESLYNYWEACIDNMYDKIKKNNLVNEFLKVHIENTGFMFNNSQIVRKIEKLTENDGHSGASFACCCHNVYFILQEEKIKERQRLKAQFRGIIKAIIQFKKLRLKAAENIYSPGGKGYLKAKEEFEFLSE